MCGIFFSLSTSHPVVPSDETRYLLQNRGPDSCQVHTVQLKHSNHCSVSSHLTFVSTVLSLRGDHVHRQPLVDPTSQSVLCWNGEAWKVAGEPVQGNDTEFIFELFLRAVKPSTEGTNNNKDAIHRLADVISSISGPFSFVFYDAFNSKLFFSRDCLGRRSLLQGFDANGSLKICSLCDGMSSTHFNEVGTDGVHMIDLTRATHTHNIETLPWVEDPSAGHLVRTFVARAYRANRLQRTPIPPMNKASPHGDPPRLAVESTPVKDLELKLRRSLELRVRNIPEPPNCKSDGAKVAVLFSGGLDCTLLARLSHEILPIDDTIDLLNVAFENPRVVAAANKDNITSAYENCPDRITGRSAFAELRKVCPDRNWRFVAVDIPYTETVAHRETVKRLMRPHNTEMDLSIACALYFASRGQGLAFESEATTNKVAASYTSSARVLLSGLGADELFAGYARHGIAYSRQGFPGLIDEINLDVSRLGKRNLGRDDRIITNWGREARYPYLDEEFVSWVLRTPVWEKCGFGTEATTGIDPEKKTLRLVALRLGLDTASREKKRAIQFGSRTAKMEKGRTKGTDALD